MSEETLLTFPCEFPIKIMGRSSNSLEAEIINIVRNHAPELNHNAVHSRASSKGNYIAITITVTATSKQQLDNIYLDLNAHESVVMTL